MPIEDLNMDKQILVGRISRGYKEEVGNGKTKPVGTPYFIARDEIERLGLAEKVYGEYGSQPTMLKIRFLDNNPHRIFQHYREEYVRDGLGGGKLRCQGDARIVRYRRYFDPRKTQGEPIDLALISDAVLAWGHLGVRVGWENQDSKIKEILAAWENFYGTSEAEGNSLRCLGKECPRAKARKCKPTGRLLFAIEGIGNPGLWQMRVHQAGVENIYTQLRQCLTWTEMLLGMPTIVNMPWHLYLADERKFRLQDSGMPVTMYPVVIQPDAKWFADVMAGRVQLPFVQPVTINDIWGGKDQPALPSGEKSVAIPDWPEPTLDYDPEEDAEYEDELADEELEEGNFRVWLLNRVDGRMRSRATEKQVGYAASMLQAVYGSGEQADVARHQLLEYLFGVSSTKELTKGQASALIEWLKGDEGRGPDGSYEPSPVVVQQANEALKTWAAEHGQMEMAI